MATTTTTNDVYQRVTDQIVASLEAGATGDQWTTPWTGSTKPLHRPVNAVSGRFYRGINVLALWAAAQAAGYQHGAWATYKQWADIGAQVRKGERATTVVLWKQVDVETEDATETGEGRTRMIARAFCVFNADQVDGYTVPAAPVVLSEATRDAAAEAWCAATGARVSTGTRAFYVPSQDRIELPVFAAFRDAAGFYSTLVHELTHWTGAKQRLDRDLTGRFRSEAYAMEELVAELGAAFALAILGLSAEPRADHAAYLASWLKVLKGDKRAIFTAAAKAQQAVDFLDGFSQIQHQGVAA